MRGPNGAVTHFSCCGIQKNVGQRPAGLFLKALGAHGWWSESLFISLSLFIWQLIRGGFDGIINLIFRLFFAKRRPAITLEDPNIKYALRLLDKQVTASPHDLRMSCGPQRRQLRSLTAALPDFSAGFLPETLIVLYVSDRQSRHQKIPLCSAVP